MTYRSGSQPLCVCCGKPIPKRTDLYMVRDPRGGNFPASGLSERWHNVAGALHNKADCQALTNLTVVSVRYHEDDSSIYRGKDEEGMSKRGKNESRLVCQFTAWDRESYVDPYFCGGTCTTHYAYDMARIRHRRAS